MKNYILRSCDSDWKSYHGNFQWPQQGEVSALDWDPKPICGKGLHGLLNGIGDLSLCDLTSSNWLVAEIDEYVALGGKVKVPRCTVVFTGSKEDCGQWIYNHNGLPAAFITVTGGDRATVTGGDGATVTGGYGATLYEGILTSIIAVFSTEQGASDFVNAQKPSFRTSYDWVEKILDKS